VRTRRTPAAAAALLLALAVLACGGAGEGPADGGRSDAPAAAEPAAPASEEGAEQGGEPGADAGVPSGFEDLAADDAATIGGEDAAVDDAEPPEPATLEAVWVQLVAPAEPPPAGAAGSGPRGGARRPGEEIGCGDRLVAVEVPVEAEVASIEDRVRVALETLLALEPGDVPSDLMTALHRSPLRVESVSPVPGTAGAYRVELGGPLRLGGTCDAPRVRAQLVDTARAVEGVEDVQVFVGGEPLDALLSARGAR
jgi:hypothetical protein